MSASVSATPQQEDRQAAISGIGVGVDGFPEGEDAVALGARLAHACRADLVLIGVRADPGAPLPLPLPAQPTGASVAARAREGLARLRDARAPAARIVIESGASVPQVLARVSERERRDLLVMGSSRHAADGHVRIGKRTRSLLGHYGHPLAIAPRGLRNLPPHGFKRIGVGYDGSLESTAALALADALALAAGAAVAVIGVVDDRVPASGWLALAQSNFGDPQWETVVAGEVRALQERMISAAGTLSAQASTMVSRGRPAAMLLAASRELDLLIIGSRRWGPVARLLLGSTGEAVAHDAACPLVIVPRPSVTP
jgi:nucleotide-binding universal stress UspA family protein